MRKRVKPRFEEKNVTTGSNLAISRENLNRKTGNGNTTGNVTIAVAALECKAGRFAIEKTAFAARTALAAFTATLLLFVGCLVHPQEALACNPEDGSYDYLAIDNSITRHPIKEYWWGEWGMAATSAENDYYHIVTQYISDNCSNSTFDVTYLLEWEELPSGEQKKAGLSVLDPYLKESLDLVTIQLGDNISDYTDIVNDYENMVDYIRQRCPNAQIIMVGNFWLNDECDNAKIQVSALHDIAYVDLTPITNERTPLGTIVYGDDGLLHVIEHDGVSQHPNDKAMRYIAEQIISNMDFTYNANVNYDSVFNADYYWSHNADLESYYGHKPHDLFNHFILVGMGEGRQGNKEFDVQYYKENNPDLYPHFGDDLAGYYTHYATKGKAEGRLGAAQE